ncbi:hypothetical protein F3Y22_tig00116951pilonHSYRG00957 [Hibiscus syriacus]|uniref:Amino acid permease/ SLC12A domain-containing protein n=1 Tax=Hibiscus syriacus TaxID=106335 RepID=A0A6A2X1B4_HIBSY|nr:hypothetical protein F3Y22_tig00116951pilonHSYRG00957 [Hibiscus syriacus]
MYTTTLSLSLKFLCYLATDSFCSIAWICLAQSSRELPSFVFYLHYPFFASRLLCGVEDCLPSFLARQHFPGLDIIVDPCAAVLTLIVTLLLCCGIKESALEQGIATARNVFAMLFVIIVGGYLDFKTGWTGYKLPNGYFPFGVDGMLAGSATASLLILALTQLLALPRSYIITVGVVTSLIFTLMGSILPQPQILMAMARDGLLPPFFSNVNKKTQVPVNSILTTGIVATNLAFFMDVSQLTGMVPIPSSLQYSIESYMLEHDRDAQVISGEDPKILVALLYILSKNNE